MSQNASQPVDAVVLGVWAAAVALRAALIPWAGCIHTDGVYYLEIAQAFAEQGLSPFHPIFPPLYPTLIAGLSAAGLPLETAGRAVSAVAGGSMVLPVAWLARRTYGGRAARYAALLVAFHPVLVHYGTYVLTEATYTTVLAVGIALGHVCLSGGRPAAFGAAGAMFGLATMLRPEAFGFVPLTALAALYGRWRRGETLRIGGRLGLMFGLFLLVCLPYAHFLKTATGSWAISGKTGVMLAKADAVGAYDLGPAAEQRQRQAGERPGLVDRVIRDPVRFAARIVTNVHLLDRYVVPDLMPVLFLVAAAFGIVRVRPSRPEEAYLIVLPAAYLPVLLFLVEARIFLPLVPVAAILAALALGRFTGWLKRTGHPRLAGSHMGLVLCLLSLLPYTLRPLFRTDENDIYRRAGIWIREHGHAPARVAFPKPWIAYYAGATRAAVPTGPPAEAVRELSDRGVTHLVVDSRIVPAYRPALLPLLCGTVATGDLTPVRRMRDPLGQTLTIYRVGQR